MSVKHAKVSAAAASQDSSLVDGPAWNANHVADLPVSLGGYLVLTNVGAAYDTIAPAKGLGVAQVDFTGAVEILFGVRVNKVGTGTQSWQLWNETDGTQIAVIDDAAAAADNRALSVSVTTGLPAGVKVVRVRAKSTVAADDPVYYGAWLRVKMA